jgi:hypothetical protein
MYLSSNHGDHCGDALAELQTTSAALRVSFFPLFPFRTP